MKKILFPVTLVSTLALSTIPANAANLILDTFSVPEPPEDRSSQYIDLVDAGSMFSTTATNLPIEEVLGGNRTISLRVIENPEDGFANFRVNARTGRLIWSNDSGVDSSAQVDWQLDRANLVQQKGFALNIVDIDLNTTLTFTIGEGNKISSLTRSNLRPGTVNFDFAQFTSIQYINLRRVDQISLRLEGPASVDATIDLIGIPAAPVPVPEPTSVLGLLAIAGLGGISLAKKKRES